MPACLTPISGLPACMHARITALAGISGRANLRYLRVPAAGHRSALTVDVPGITADLFLDSITHVLIPNLNDSTGNCYTVLMDNLEAHKRAVSPGRGLLFWQWAHAHMQGHGWARVGCGSSSAVPVCLRPAAWRTAFLASVAFSMCLAAEGACCAACPWARGSLPAQVLARHGLHGAGRMHLL